MLNWIRPVKNVLNWSALFTISLLIGIWMKVVSTGLASFVSGDASNWKASWTIGMAIFTFSCYCLDECVKMKRAQLP
ncbi:hypothetical protein DCAR_0933478 [Daucus carota subsp. sativus]|uniref:Uncharacterized protein n=1 Tax=Daucus carota subsp. sativus TaxID=79200 RepID=A0A175YDH9_DAUCS|nr:hypothetical protein DCAR_0933478 [Daucus carota subsp. sativus]